MLEDNGDGGGYSWPNVVAPQANSGAGASGYPDLVIIVFGAFS